MKKTWIIRWALVGLFPLSMNTLWAQGAQMGGTPQQMGGTPQQMGGSSTNARPASVFITPWGGGGGIYPMGARFSVLLNTQKRKLQIGTAVAVPNKPISRSPVTTLAQGIDPARRMLRGGQKLNMGFVRFIKTTPGNLASIEAKSYNTRTAKAGNPAPGKKMISGATYPSIGVRRIFRGNVATQRRATNNGRVRSNSRKRTGFNVPIGGTTGATAVYGNNNSNRRSSLPIPSGGRAIGRSQRRR